MANRYIQGEVVMSAKDISSIANYADLHLQPVRKLSITVEVIDKDNNTIETIQGWSTGGNLNVSGSSLIRRTGNLSFVLLDALLPKKGSMLWMTNKIRVYAGIENLSSSNGTITHFCLGTFYITEPSIDISKDSRTVTINLEDNMMRWEQEQLENKLVIEAGTPLNTAIASLMNMYGEWNVHIEFTDLKVPYTLEFNEGDAVLDILTKLRDLYMDWDCYYDVDGTFVFKRMKIQREEGEPVAWKFDKSADLVTIFKESFTYKNVKNRVVVIGSVNEATGLTPRSEAIIGNTDSPFHSNEIGVRSKVITDSSYGDSLQCDARARYELFKCSTFQEKADINTIPIYYLDVNNLIEITNYATKEVERYVVDSISIGLGIEDEMGLSCHKVYYNHFDVNSTLESFQSSANKVIDGIENKGWLSLAEARISQYLGLEGDGSKLIVKFEYNGRHGVTAYITGYIGDTTQSLTIDLADFENPIGDSGDTGNGKAEYADRILGHEMVHAVMNNALALSKVIALPEWFKEGIAELIHGADERLKISITVSGVVNDTKLTNVVNRATELLNGSPFQSASDDYSAGYVIVKYLNAKITAGKSMRDLMWSIKQSASDGLTALKDAIVSTTGFATYQDFVTDFSANAFNHVKFTLDLDAGDEVDTGSIGGSEEDGVTALNAETVFDNRQAIQGVSSTGFKVEFMRP